MPSLLRLHFPAFPALLVWLLLVTAMSAALAENLPDAQRLMKQGQWSLALEKVDAHLASQPSEVQGRFLKGVILTEMGRSAAAIAVFKKLAEDYPELPEPYNNLAVLYAQQKQYDKARTALEMAIRTHPSYATAHENLGDVYAKLASQAYDKALQLDSSNRVTQSKLAMIRELITTAPGAAAKPGAAVLGPADAADKAVAEPAKAPTIVAVAPPPSAMPLPKPAERVAKQPAAPAPAAAPVVVEKAEQPPVAQVVAAKPELPKAPPAAPAGDEAGVKKALLGWASAWSDKNMKAYLDHYADDFRTPRGMSRKAWAAERSKRIDKPGKIEVGVEEITISFADNKATVSFRQNYSSPTLKSSVRKALTFVKTKGRWLIEQERVG